MKYGFFKKIQGQFVRQNNQYLWTDSPKQFYTAVTRLSQTQLKGNIHKILYPIFPKQK